MTQENKINIAELLKDCLQGMELDCTIYEDVYFDYVDELSIIHCYIQREYNRTSITFNQHGTIGSDIKTKCVIFPKGKTTWEGFQRPFKDGDIINIITENNNEYITIFKDNTDKGIETYIDISIGNFKCSLLDSLFYTDNIKYQRLATEEEKEKLFQAIKDNGYKWNEETKTLEKLVEPKFKVGNRVKHISAYTQGIVVKVTNKGYHIDYPKGEGICYVSFTLEKDYELAPNKFDINTLKPFDKVLARDTYKQIWNIDFFSHRIKGVIEGYKFACIGHCWYQCIPYEGNEHLLGTTDDCDDFYKTW